MWFTNVISINISAVLRKCGYGLGEKAMEKRRHVEGFYLFLCFSWLLDSAENQVIQRTSM